MSQMHQFPEDFVILCKTLSLQSALHRLTPALPGSVLNLEVSKLESQCGIFM